MTHNGFQVPSESSNRVPSSSRKALKTLATAATKDGASENLADAAYLLLDQARIIEGEIPEDPAAFSRRLADVMAKGVGG